jgi:hypothetical protein
MSILLKIRQKPDNQKKIFSLISASILTLIIVVVWFSFNDSSAEKVTLKESEKLSSISPMKMIKEEFSNIFSNFNSQMADIDISSTSDEVLIDSPVTTSTATSTAVSDINI